MSAIKSEGNSASAGTASVITRAQGATIIILLLVALLGSLLPVIHPIGRWEYQTLEFPGTGISRTGSLALSASTIQVDSSKLKVMGEQGWELVDSYLEVETAFPNFGKEEYVTGLRENIRPQKVVLLFKRRVGLF
ncbi:hypothetical protein J7I44_03245 [Frateuria sp. MAH-13]|uniref:Uncharacterized protein n=1 Tax=Frateuria flava TaxID=2821489 RepID=A0ABS4DJR5_9GAMM|nr:hypothetical protein [Frateuria flava]MBP1473297.1 hypothetical protein [Frateuria flava]